MYRGKQLQYCALNFAFIERTLLGTIIKISHPAGSTEVAQGTKEPGCPIWIAGPAESHYIPVP